MGGIIISDRALAAYIFLWIVHWNERGQRNGWNERGL